MSKSYAKHKSVGICVGSNTSFYRNRRKLQRHINKNRMRAAIAKSDTDEIEDNFQPYNIVKKDHWEEPTDGTVKYSPKEVKKLHEDTGKHFGLYVDKTNNKIKK